MSRVPYFEYGIGKDCEEDLYYLPKPDVICRDKYLFQPRQVCDSLIFLREGELEITFIINEKGLGQLKDFRRGNALKGPSLKQRKLQDSSLREQSQLQLQLCEDGNAGQEKQTNRNTESVD